MGVGSGAGHIKSHAPLYSLGPEMYVYHPAKPRVLKVISPNCTIAHLNCTDRSQRVSKMVYLKFPPTICAPLTDWEGTLQEQHPVGRDLSCYATQRDKQHSKLNNLN